MRERLIIVLSIIACFESWGQSQNSIFLRTSDNSRLYYIDLQRDQAKVYHMVHYIDKAGSGSVIRKVDTLYRSTATQYIDNEYVLFFDGKKGQLTVSKKKLRLEGVHVASAYYDLNKAHHLTGYFGLSDSLNKKFPLYHYSFRNGFYRWDAVPVKNGNPEVFILETNREIKKIYDSISAEQNKYVRITNFLVANLLELSDSTVIDSLSRLPREQASSSRYFETVVYEIAKQKPNSFFKIADAFSSNSSIIFSAVQKDKSIIKLLRKANGNPRTKDAFFRGYD
jgi:hypothetical protein